MAEPQTFYDLEFHFTDGELLRVDTLEGRDVIQDVDRCPHCGSAPSTKVTVNESDGTETTYTVHRDKLNAVQSTKRIVQPDEP